MQHTHTRSSEKYTKQKEGKSVSTQKLSRPCKQRVLKLQNNYELKKKKDESFFHLTCVSFVSPSLTPQQYFKESKS